MDGLQAVPPIILSDTKRLLMKNGEDLLISATALIVFPEPFFAAPRCYLPVLEFNRFGEFLKLRGENWNSASLRMREDGFFEKQERIFVLQS